MRPHADRRAVRHGWDHGWRWTEPPGGADDACLARRSSCTRKPARPHKGETKLSWNAHGQTGASGKSGTNGAAGTNGLNGANGAVAGYSTTGADEVEILTGSEEHPVTVASLSLPAGNFIVRGDAYVFLRDEESNAEILGTCELVDTDAVGQDVATQTVGWIETVMKPFFSGYVSDLMIPLALAVSSPTHVSTVALECYPETATSTGNFKVISDASVITAIQTTQND